MALDTAQKVNPEFLSEVANTAITALLKTKKLHDDLGVAGQRMVHKNQFGDTAMRGDIESEAVILQEMTQAGFPIIFFTEEHGIVSPEKDILYVGVVDGMDGSSVYKEDINGRYGTMMGIFTGRNPYYSEYLFSGVMEHAAGKLYYAMQSNGAWVIKNGEKRKLHCQSTLDVAPGTMIYADTNYDSIYHKDVLTSKMKKFTDYDVVCLKSSAMHYVDLVAGVVPVVIENTRKGNLEIASAFALVTEAGGVMYDIHGRKISERRYFEYGQDENIPVVSACSEEVAKKIIEIFNS